MDEYMSEKEQIEEIKRWWSENGRFVIAGVVLGVGVLGGLRGWTNYKESRLEQASGLYTRVAAAAEQRDRELALDLAGELETEYARTPYNAQAALTLAKLHMEADEPEDAALQLERALAASRDAELNHVVRLRLARVRLYQQKAQEALEVLGMDSPGKFATLYHEVRGDIQLALGDRDAARNEYALALAAFEQGLADRTLLEMKLNDLGTIAPDDSFAIETESDS